MEKLAEANERLEQDNIKLRQQGQEALSLLSAFHQQFASLVSPDHKQALKRGSNGSPKES